MATQILTQVELESSAPPNSRETRPTIHNEIYELHPISQPSTHLPSPPIHPVEPHEIHDQTSRLPFTRLISAYLCLAAIYFISSLDINSVATALPAISRSLDAGNSITWAGTAYLMGQTSFQVLYGRLSDIFGRKPVLLISTGFLVVGDILCGFAQNPTWLYICRALSGIGGGGISSLVQIIVSDLVSMKERGKYQGILNGAIGLGSSVGPFIAASLLRDSVSSGWRWIFWLPPILGSTCAILMWRFLPLKPVTGSWKEKLGKIDWFGLGMAVFGMVFFLIPINSGGNIWPWHSALIISMLLLGGIAFVLFGFIEKRIAKIPLVPLRLFNQKSTTILLLQGALYNWVWQVDLYFLPLYLQDARGYSPSKSAVLILPYPLVGSITGVISGPLMSKFARYDFMLYAGMVLWTLGAGMKLLFSRTTPIGLYVITLIIEGMGTGFVFQPGISDFDFILYFSFPLGIVALLTSPSIALVALQALSKPQDRAVATSTRNLLRMLGSVIGLAVSTAIQFAIMKSSLPATLPPELRAQVLNGSWQIGDSRSEPWESDILNAKMNGIHAVFTVLLPLMGTCLVGCIWIPNTILKAD